MLVYGEDEENATWDTGYFGVILQSVTIDGWVVIAHPDGDGGDQLVVMATKARYISRIARANASFLDSFSTRRFRRRALHVAAQ